MEKYCCTIGIAAVLLLAGIGNAADTKTQNFRCATSGTFANGVETLIDTNDDGISATLDQGLQNCNTGRSFFNEETEYQAPLDADHLVNCPAGTFQEFHIWQGRGVVSDEKTGAQLFY